DHLTAFSEVGFSVSQRVYRSPAPGMNGLSPTTNFLLGGLAAPFQAILPVGHPDNPHSDARSAIMYRFENIKGGTDLENRNIRAVAG
ncbi:hypothetical protein, partial [Sphingomonas sp. 10B4]